MASLLQPLTSFSLPLSPPIPPSSSSSSSTTTATATGTAATSAFPINLRSSERRRLRTASKSYTWTSGLPKRSLVLRSTLDEVSVVDPPPPPEDSKAELLSCLKLKLMSAVSGLNRGLAASEDDQPKADAAAKELEGAGGPVDLSSDLNKLQGRWKLIYSSAFSSQTLGGSRPGPPTGRLLPITLGRVFQRIDIVSQDFDNIVELRLGAPWPLPPVELTATLAHKFELIGTSSIRITFEKTTVKASGNLSQLPPLEVPRIPDALRPPSNSRNGEFEVTYLDSDTRITRGDRGELRVFVIA